jgi:hypothetical protein
VPDEKRILRLSALLPTKIGNGAISCGLPTNLLHSIVAKLTGANRIAFVHHGVGSGLPRLRSWAKATARSSTP